MAALLIPTYGLSIGMRLVPNVKDIRVAAMSARVSTFAECMEAQPKG